MSTPENSPAAAIVATASPNKEAPPLITPPLGSQESPKPSSAEIAKVASGLKETEESVTPPTVPLVPLAAPLTTTITSHKISVVPKEETEQTKPNVELPSGTRTITVTTTTPQLSILPSPAASSFVLTMSQAQAAQHIRIPSVPTHIRTASTPPRVPGSISIARPVSSNQILSGSTTFITTGQHRLPMTPIITSIATSVQPRQPNAANVLTKNSPISLAVLHDSSKLLQSPTSTLEVVSVKSPASQTSMRPLTAGVTLTTGFPVTIRSPGPGKSTVINNPIQLVPLSSGSPLGRGGGTIISQANIRQIKPPAVRTPLGPEHPVRVTLVQSSATISKLAQGQTSGFYKPVTITSQTARHLRPHTQITSTCQPLRIGAPNVTQQHSINVALSPSHINVPLVSQAQQPLARILTPGGARLINVPSSLSASPGGGVTIQKTIVTTSLPQAKTITLPYGTSPIVTPKASNTGIPVARVIPQLSGAMTGSMDTSLFITRPVIQPMQYTSESPLIVTSIPVMASSDGKHPRTPQKQVYSARPDLEINVPISPRPGILRRREGERELNIEPPLSPRPPRPESGGGSSSGSTTLSATSSPCDAANLSGEEMPPVAILPSPRKKPRKQQHSNVRDHSWNDYDEQANRSPQRRKVANSSSAQQRSEDSFLGSSYFKGKPQMSLITSYRHTWKSRHNHFLKYTDVRAKDERKPTVNELANQGNILQKINGWKIYHLSGQIEDVIDIEVELSRKLSHLQKRLDKMAHRDLSKEVGTIQEIIKANLQRSKVIQDQVTESKQHSIQLFDHKTRVNDIISRYLSKRQIKKREFKM